MSIAKIREYARFILGSHDLRVNTGAWEHPHLLRHQRICLHCESGTVDDEQHAIFCCSSLYSVRVTYRRLFTARITSVQSFMSQLDQVGVVNFIYDLVQCRLIGHPGL